MNPDVLIIGAGLIGLTAARELQARGLNVEIWDQSLIGQESSWAAAGMLAGTLLSRDPRLRAIAQASLETYPEFIAQLELETGLTTGYRASGTLFLARPKDEPELRRELPNQDVVWLEPKDVAILEPGLRHSDPVCFFPRDHSVNSRQLLAACAASVRLRKIPIYEGRQALRVRRLGNGDWMVEGGRQRQIARHVINAAGAWASRIEAPVAPAVRPVKGQILRLEAASWELRHVIIAHDFYLVPRAAGATLVGATQEDIGFDKSVHPAQLHELWERARASIPAMEAAPVREMWAGLRPATPDGLPLLGSIPSNPGYWLATGHFREGILLAPWTARVLSDLITDRAVSDDVYSVSPARFVA